MGIMMQTLAAGKLGDGAVAVSLCQIYKLQVERQGLMLAFKPQISPPVTYLIQ